MLPRSALEESPLADLHVLAAAWGWTEARTTARISGALGLVDLASVGERPARGYSTGMRQRLTREPASAGNCASASNRALSASKSICTGS